MIAFAAGVIVIGCSPVGTGIGTTTGGGTTGTTGGTTGGRSVASATLPTTFSDARMVFLSGAGRSGQNRAPGSEYAKLNNIRLVNSPTDIFPDDLTGSLDGVNMKLDGYTVNKATAIGEIGVAGSKNFTGLSMFVNEMYEEDLLGNLVQVFGGPAILLPTQTVNMTLAPGRQTTVQVFLSNASLWWDNATSQVRFDQASFDIENDIATSGVIRGFFSDHIAFDISGVASRPSMAMGGAPAQKVFFSGDAMGISNGTSFDGSFDLYGPSFVESGVVTNPVQVGGDIAPGTYTVLEPDPQVIAPPITKISALQGAWRNYTDVFSNIGEESMFIFPTTRDHGQHQVVLVKRSGGVITDLWYGRITMSGSSGTVEIWSVDQLDDATENNKATGTFSVVSSSGGVFKDGDFTFTTIPTGFPFEASGTGVFFQ